MCRSNLVTTRCVSVASLLGCLFLGASLRGAEASEAGKGAAVPPNADQAAPRIPAGFRLAKGGLAEPYTHTGWAKEIVHGTSGIEMVYVPAGSFLMGSPANEKNRQPDEVQRQVVLTHGFYLGKFELTQKQCQQVMGSTIQKQRDKEDPKAGLVGIGLDMPMYFVNWDDAQELCLKLGTGFRLPTEAEWEYACRAGTTGAYAGPIKEMGWTPENSGRVSIDAEAILKRVEGRYQKYGEQLSKNGCRPHPVGGKKANAWGLYDMHGNLWEWCQDWYGPVDAKEATDPTGPGQGTERVNRGGSWLEVGLCARSAMRMRDPKEGRGINLGFRVAFTPNVAAGEPGRSVQDGEDRQAPGSPTPAPPRDICESSSVFGLPKEKGRTTKKNP